MMAEASDNSNRNGGVAMGMSGSERISSNLIIRLMLVPYTFLLFCIRS